MTTTIRLPIGILALLSCALFAAPSSAERMPQQPTIMGAPRINVQVSGDHVVLASGSVAKAKTAAGYLQANEILATYRCRRYQGTVHRKFIKVREGERNIEVRNDGIRAQSRKYTVSKIWRDVKLMSLARIRNACRGRSDTVRLEATISLRNSCGSSERHFRNGSGKAVVLAHCSASTISPRVTPVRWRYECTGPNMFIEGTNQRSVERNTPDANLRCVYRGR